MSLEKTYVIDKKLSGVIINQENNLLPDEFLAVRPPISNILSRI
jgi:hypothetical protein